MWPISAITGVRMLCVPLLLLYSSQTVECADVVMLLQLQRAIACFGEHGLVHACRKQKFIRSCYGIGSRCEQVRAGS